MLFSPLDVVVDLTAAVGTAQTLTGMCDATLEDHRNGFSNAVTFTPEGGVVTSEGRGKGATFTVIRPFLQARPASPAQF